MFKFLFYQHYYKSLSLWSSFVYYPYLPLLHILNFFKKSLKFQPEMFKDSSKKLCLKNMGRRIKCKNKIRKIVDCIFKCLEEEKYSEVIKWIEKGKVFSVMFKHRKARDWKKEHLDFFKELDQVSPTKGLKYMQQDDYDQGCKRRCKANLNKMCDDGIIKFMRGKNPDKCTKVKFFEVLDYSFGLPSSFKTLGSLEQPVPSQDFWDRQISSQGFLEKSISNQVVLGVIDSESESEGKSFGEMYEKSEYLEEEAKEFDQGTSRFRNSDSVSSGDSGYFGKFIDYEDTSRFRNSDSVSPGDSDYFGNFIDYEEYQPLPHFEEIIATNGTSDPLSETPMNNFGGEEFGNFGESQIFSLFEEIHNTKNGLDGSSFLQL